MKSDVGPLATAVLSSVLFLASHTARGQPAEASGTTVEARGEYSSYADSNDVYVYTPAIAGGARNALDGWSVNGGYLIDIVSAASVDIVSTATPAWQEVRHAGNLTAGYKPSTVGATAGGSVSREPDYLSLSGGGNLSLELRDKTITLVGGYTYTHDTAGRRGTPFSVYSLVLERHTLTSAINLVLDPTTSLTFGGDVILERGRQEKPYRYVPLFSAEVAPTIAAGAPAAVVNDLRLPGRIAELLPTERNRYALTARLAQRLESSTLVVWERGYFDDWGVAASTTDLRLVFDVGERFFLWPHLRVHVQSGASFWQRAYVSTLSDSGAAVVPRLRTGDRELSPLTGFTGGLGARWDLSPRVSETRYSLVFLGDGAVTRYSDALFISNRYAVFGALQLEATFK